MRRRNNGAHRSSESRADDDVSMVGKHGAAINVICTVPVGVPFNQEIKCILHLHGCRSFAKRLPPVHLKVYSWTLDSRNFYMYR